MSRIQDFAEALSEAGLVYFEAEREVKRLQAENAELLAFASEAWELLACNEPSFVWIGLRKKARELGVEVASV